MNPVGFAQALQASFKSAPTFDAPSYTARQKRREEAYFEHTRRAAFTYSIQLRKVARHIGELIKHFNPLEAFQQAEMQQMLDRYSELLRPWARTTAHRMVTEVARRDEQAWFKASQMLSVNLRKEVQGADIGDVVRKILDDQVHLITSLPIEAGRRVQELARNAVVEGTRYKQLVPQIQDMGNITVSRANLIARTEVSKASTAMTQARAKHIGSQGYIWRTSMDVDVRRMHKALEGSFHSWDDPPIAEVNGQRHHPGEFPNCRCWPEPIIPAEIE